jgi:hypothetical protein
MTPCCMQPAACTYCADCHSNAQCCIDQHIHNKSPTTKWVLHAACCTTPLTAAPQPQRRSCPRSFCRSHSANPQHTAARPKRHIKSMMIMSMLLSNSIGSGQNLGRQYSACNRCPQVPLCLSKLKTIISPLLCTIDAHPVPNRSCQWQCTTHRP